MHSWLHADRPAVWTRAADAQTVAHRNAEATSRWRDDLVPSVTTIAAAASRALQVFAGKSKAARARWAARAFFAMNAACAATGACLLDVGPATDADAGLHQNCANQLVWVVLWVYTSTTSERGVVQKCVTRCFSRACRPRL